MARPARPMNPTRRRALLETAAERFVQYGYERAAFNSILEASGVAKSSAYHHIGDKHALFAAVMDDRLQLLERFVDLPDPDALTADDYWLAVEGVLDSLGRAAKAEPRTLEAGRLIHLTDAPETPAGMRLREVLAGWADAMLAHGRKLGCVDASVPLELQRSLIVAVAITVDRWALQQEASDAAHRASADVLHRLLRPGS